MARPCWRGKLRLLHGRGLLYGFLVGFAAFFFAAGAGWATASAFAFSAAHRAVAAALADADRSAFESDFARLSPPARPRATAAGFFSGIFVMAKVYANRYAISIDICVPLRIN